MTVFVRWKSCETAHTSVTRPNASSKESTMRLYEGLIPTMATEMAKVLLEAEFLDVEPGYESELELDIQAVLKEYVRMDKEISRAARDASYADPTGSNHFKLKKRFARERNFKIGDDSLEYIVQQLIGGFFHSAVVEEVYAEDHDLRRIITPVLKRHMETEAKLDIEVRSKIKNLEEGSRTWDIEYQKAMENLKRTKKIE